MDGTETVQERQSRDALVTVGLCFLAAAFEGVDLQSMAIAAPKLTAEFHLNRAQFGTAASMSLAGLLIGALIGGRLADRLGRRAVLIGSLVILAIFSLVTTLATGYASLLGIRFAVGLGLGGAFPTIIALVSETVGGDRRALPISIMYAGIPFGTIIGALMVLHFGAAFQWRWIFYVGGFGPLALAPILMLALPESARFVRPRDAAGPGASVPEALFGEDRARSTLLLWLSFFFTLLVIYLLTNWLNQLMAARGLDRAQSTGVLLCFGVGSVCGSLSLGLMTDAGYQRATAAFAYTGVAISLLGLAFFKDVHLLFAAGLCAGFFAIGSQLVNYALAPRYYPVPIRGTGLGWTTAVGRLGSFFGPLIGGLLLNAGLTAPMVLVLFIPGLVIAATASSLLLWRPEPSSEPSPEPSGA